VFELAVKAYRAGFRRFVEGIDLVRNGQLFVLQMLRNFTLDLES
jgi:hypothetical protein